MFFILFMLCTTYGYATTIPQVTILTLYDQADVVAIVNIESGEIIEGKEFPCGAKYRSKVIEPLKNTKVDQYLEFGYFIGQGIGNKYLVFLTKKPNIYAPVISTNSYSAFSKSYFDRQCKSKHPDYEIMHHGYGIQEMEFPSEANYKDAFLISTEYLKLPSSTKTISPEREICNLWERCMWVTKESILEILPRQ